MTEEIAAEAATRNLDAFSRFLALAGITNGQMVNYSKMASDAGRVAEGLAGWTQSREELRTIDATGWRGGRDDAAIALALAVWGADGGVLWGREAVRAEDERFRLPIPPGG